MKVRIRVENLEGKALMASGVTVGLAGGVLAIVGSSNADSVRVSNPDASTVRVEVAGDASPLDFSATKVRQLFVLGNGGDDSLVNLTNVNAIIDGGSGNDYIHSGTTLGTGGNDALSGGDGDDTVFDSGGTNILLGGNGADNIWGFGSDVISAGAGDDTVYNIVGAAGQINGGAGKDRVITNGNFKVVSDSADRPAVVFKTRDSTVALDNGVLYFAGDASNNVVDVQDNGDGTITTFYTDSSGTRVDTFNKADVTQVAGVLGAGDDTLNNDTNIDGVFYGASGNDFLQGGGGRDLLKGGSGDDTLLGRGGNDDLTGDGGFDYLDGGSGANTLRGGFDGQDTVITGPLDLVIGDPLLLIGTPKRRAGNLGDSGVLGA